MATREPVAGNIVSYRLLPDDRTKKSASVVAWDDIQVRLRMEGGDTESVRPDRHLVILEEDGETEHYGLITARDGDLLSIKQMMTGKRGYFRVSDTFPVLCRRIDAASAPRGSITKPGYGFGAVMDQPDESVSPRIWNMLTDINAKLGLILEHLKLESTGLIRTESVPVNVSASGIRLTLAERFSPGALIEVRMLLPGTPPTAVTAYGRAVRADERAPGAYETAIQFTDLDHDVQDTIIQYALNRQREIIWKLKQ